MVEMVKCKYCPLYGYPCWKNIQWLAWNEDIQLKICSDVLVWTPDVMKGVQSLCAVEFYVVKKLVLTYTHPLPYSL